MTIRRIVLVATLVLVPASATVNATTGQAAEPTTCSYEHDAHASPGLSTNPSSGKVTSNGETPTITCNGPVNGKQPTGPGTIGFDGRYGTTDPDTCQAGGEGEGVFSITVPTSSGPEHIEDAVQFRYGAFKAGTPFAGSATGERTSAAFDAQPIEGDCAAKPVTKYRINGTITLKR